MEVDLIEHKCTNCAMVFQSAKDLARHTNRKTPCVIVEIADENKDKPNCAYCKKIFTSQKIAKQHSLKCKNKPEIVCLDDKPKLEQEMPTLITLITQITLMTEEFAKLKKEIQELKSLIIETPTKPKAEAKANNEVNVIPEVKFTPIVHETTRHGITRHITYSVNFPLTIMDPKLDHLTFELEDFTENTNILAILFKKVYFDKKFPENHLCYVPDYNIKRIKTYRPPIDEWVSPDENESARGLGCMCIRAYKYGLSLFNTGGIFCRSEMFKKLSPNIQNNINKLIDDPTVNKLPFEELFDIVYKNSDMVQETHKTLIKNIVIVDD